MYCRQEINQSESCNKSRDAEHFRAKYQNETTNICNDSTKKKVTYINNRTCSLERQKNN